MMIAGIAVTLLGFLISVASLGAMSSVNGRMVMVLVGIAVSLVGIIGVLNRAFLSKAIWRK
jgi:cytochrome c biogenesis protein CcdA